MSDRDQSDQRPIDRLYLLSIIAYALLAVAFVGYFVWRMIR